ncbi:MAG: hypothetical protein JWQ43_432 [Glaciihabitans sp.]|nr:hypothetical protein [Glaciihabitans sp.]
MSNIYQPTSSTEGSTEASTSAGTADVAKDQTKKVAGDAKAATENVVGTAKDQAASVAGEAKKQAKDLLSETSSQLKEQAGTQQQRVATGLRSLSDELGSMADKSDGGGIASDLVQQAASRAGSIAGWLDDRDPGSLLEEVRNYARRSPGTFIGIAAVAGVLAGRLTRSITSVAADEKAAAETSPSAAPTTPATVGAMHTTDVTPTGAVTGAYTTDATVAGGYGSAGISTGSPATAGVYTDSAGYTDPTDPLLDTPGFGTPVTSAEIIDADERDLRNGRS